jgi:hypothetical protein
MVECEPYEMALENSNRAETGEFAAFLSGLSEGELTFRQPRRGARGGSAGRRGPNGW